MKKHYYLLLTILITSLSFAQVASDDFTYSDGSLVGNGAWVTHSGNAGDLLVSSGQVVVQHGTPSEDANLPFTPVSGNLYFGIDFTVDSSSDIPGNDNEYFAHFKNATSGYRGRLDVVPGTGGGNYTIGLSSSGSSADATWGTDLTFGVTYRAIVEYDQDSGVAQLWIDASSSGDTSITGDTPSSGTSIESFALRQSDSDNNETITVDNLVVGQTFAEALGASSTTESIPWSDDLEGDLSEFTTYQASSGTGMWAITTSRYHSGAQSVYHSDATGDHDSWLLTPTFDLSGATAPELKYWDNENYASYYDNHEVLVSEDYTDDVAAATWTELADGVSTEDTWVERGPLALPTTGTVTVAFRYEGNYADAWYLDDISVAEAPANPNTVLADPTLGWLGYMNVFDLTGGAQGGYLFGSAWGVPDVATTLNTDTDYMTITLEPNYNTYADNPGDAYWQDGSVGAKWMEGSTYVESASDWNDGELTFTGYVYHHSLATGWTANFFIKALDPNAGYSDALNGAYVTALPTDGVFSVTVPASELLAGYIVQAGFAVNGPNANPDNQAANGKVILGGDVDAPMSIDDVDVLDMRIYPNPVDGNFVTILSPINGTKYIQVFDINGRRVMDTAINGNTLDVSSINSGFYMIKVTIDGQSKISKLVVR